MRIELSGFVASDLETIGDYIAEDNPARAVTFIQEIRAAIRRVGKSPLAYQLRPEIGEDARMAVLGRYVILFRIVQNTVRIERIVYGGRDLPALFLQ